MIYTRIKPFRLLIVAMVAAVIQMSFIHRLSVGYAGIDLIAIMAAFITISATSSGTALPAGLFLGLLHDLGSMGRPGTGALSMLTASLMTWILKESFYKPSLLADLIFGFFFIFCFGLAYSALMQAFYSQGVSLNYLYYALGHAALSTALIPPFFAIFRGLGITYREKTTF